MKMTVLGIAAVSALVATVSANATELTGNASIVSNYIWRGVDGSNGKAAAQGGLDFSAGIFYAGTWLSTVEVANTADVCTGAGPLPSDCMPLSVLTSESSGIEIDLYAGLAGNVGDFSWGVGGTYYDFTDQVAETFLEANFSAGFKWFSISINPGSYDSQPTSQDYVFYSGTAEVVGIYGTIGYWDWESTESWTPEAAYFFEDGTYYELGYGNTLTVNDVELFDYTISYIYSEDELRANEQSPNTLVFGIKRNIPIIK